MLNLVVFTSLAGSPAPPVSKNLYSQEARQVAYKLLTLFGVLKSGIAK